MEAWILVLQNPYYFVTSKDGAYSIKDIPAGEYKLIAWHEKLKNKEQTITVSADGSVKVDFSLSRR